MAERTAAERGRDVRRKLLVAAAELIPELGWAGVSTRAVAARAGVGAGLVHYHFASLQALLSEAAVGVMREAVVEGMPALRTAGTPESGLTMLLRSLDAETGTDPRSLLFVETYLAATRDESLRDRLRELLAGVQRELADWLCRHGRPLPEQTASVVAAAIDGMLLHRALNPNLTSATVAPVLRRLLEPTDRV